MFRLAFLLLILIAAGEALLGLSSTSLLVGDEERVTDVGVVMLVYCVVHDH